MNIIKIPLNDAPAEIENNFGKLDKKNLKLDMIENPNKLKPDLKDTKVEIKNNSKELTEIEKKVKSVIMSKHEEYQQNEENDKIEEESVQDEKNDEIESQYKPESEKDHNEDIYERISNHSQDYPQHTDNDFAQMNEFLNTRNYQTFEPPSIPSYQYPPDTFPTINEKPYSHSHTQSKYEEEEEEEDEEEHTTQKPDIQEERSDIIWSLKKLKKSHDIKTFPHYDEFTSIDDLKRILKEVKREVILDENINSTKSLLTMGWLGLEKVCTCYLSIDLTGFAQHELQHMNEYHKILVEMGERSYLNWTQDLPPEIRLLCLMLMNAFLFHAKKSNMAGFVFDKLGFFNKPPDNNESEMRGPSKIF